VPKNEEKELIIENLKGVADMLVETFGRNCEAVIHDLTSLQRSLKYIAGTVTRRKPGAPITDLVVKALSSEGNGVKNIPSYRSKTKSGRILKSSTSFFRNKKGEVIVAFCVNFDVTDFLNSASLIDDFTSDSHHKHTKNKETFASSPEETIGVLLDEAIAEQGKQPSTLSAEERIELIQILENKGTFLMKGSVDQVAITMGVSRYTVYNHLRTIRKTKQNNVI
jgi:predicted transcriptional regulator YheO